MTIVSKEFVAYILDILAPFGDISARGMFGGYGVYKEGLIFGIIVDDTLYFKMSEANRKIFEEAGSHPFTYQRKDTKPVTMSYWEVPLTVIEDQEQCVAWAEAAYEVAKQRKSKKR